MKNDLLKSDLATTQSPRFETAIEGASHNIEIYSGSVISRRVMRRSRRANRAL